MWVIWGLVFAIDFEDIEKKIINQVPIANEDHRLLSQGIIGRSEVKRLFLNAKLLFLEGEYEAALLALDKIFVRDFEIDFFFDLLQKMLSISREEQLSYRDQYLELEKLRLKINDEESIEVNNVFITFFSPYKKYLQARAVSRFSTSEDEIVNLLPLEEYDFTYFLEEVSKNLPKKKKNFTLDLKEANRLFSKKNYKKVISLLSIHPDPEAIFLKAMSFAYLKKIEQATHQMRKLSPNQKKLVQEILDRFRKYSLKEAIEIFEKDPSEFKDLSVKRNNFKDDRQYWYYYSQVANFDEIVKNFRNNFKYGYKIFISLLNHQDQFPARVEVTETWLKLVKTFSPGCELLL